MIRGNQRDDLLRATARVVMHLGVHLSSNVHSDAFVQALDELSKVLKVVDDDYAEQEQEEGKKPRRLR